MDISIKRGETKSFALTITDADGNPYELKEYEFIVFGVKAKASHNTPYAIEKKITLSDYDTEKKFGI